VINTTAAPVLRCRRAIRSRTCACTVTSSAMVGSSAMISFGLPAIAAAITARWRMPPENWCGYCTARLSGSAMSAARSGATARAGALAGRSRPCATPPLGDLAADREQRVQRHGGVLEHQADVLPAHPPQRGGRGADDLPAGEQDRAGDGRIRRQQPGRGERGDALAGPGFADYPEHLAGVDVAIAPANRRDGRPRAAEGDRQRTDRQDRWRHRGRAAVTRSVSGSSPQRRRVVRSTSMLSMSRVKPETFFAVTIRSRL